MNDIINFLFRNYDKLVWLFETQWSFFVFRVMNWELWADQKINALNTALSTRFSAALTDVRSYTDQRVLYIFNVIMVSVRNLNDRVGELEQAKVIDLTKEITQLKLEITKNLMLSYQYTDGRFNQMGQTLAERDKALRMELFAKFDWINGYYPLLVSLNKYLSPTQLVILNGWLTAGKSRLNDAAYRPDVFVYGNMADKFGEWLALHLASELGADINLNDVLPYFIGQ